MDIMAQLSKCLTDIEEPNLDRHIDFLGIDAIPSDVKQTIVNALNDKDFIESVTEKLKEEKKGGQ